MPEWSKNAFWTASALLAAGFLLIGLAWNGAAGKDFIQGQFPYLISGGLTGLGLVLGGLTIVIVHSARRDATMLATKLDEVADLLQRLDSQGPVPSAVPSAGALVVAARRSFHRPECHMAAGRDDLQLMGLEEAEHRGLAPCRVCRPADLATA